MAERRDERLGRRRLHLRLRFLAGESTGSYVTRLAARNHLPVEGMLRSMGTGPMLPVEPQYTEMYLSRYARERLANLAGHPLAEMQKWTAPAKLEANLRGAWPARTRRHEPGGTLLRIPAAECSRRRNVSFPCCTTPPIPWWRLSHP
jgi:alpha-beta hydrolase superfamily lysophospholipase